MSRLGKEDSVIETQENISWTEGRTIEIENSVKQSPLSDNR